jgi:hypothetical protein
MRFLLLYSEIAGRVRVFGLGLLVLGAGCGRPAVGARATSDAAPPPPATWTSCGDLGCRQYDSVEEAFKDAIALTDGSTPRVVSIGEAHAQMGATAPSSASRFSSQLLPLLAGRASDLFIEILKPPTGCTAVTKEVRKQQERVTASQATTDQDEYVAMGTKARQLGIIPDLLRPTCADLDAIHAAGEGAIDTSLRTIERLTESQVKKALENNALRPGDNDKMVVTYGGALHNALHPTEVRAAWSFGPALDAYTKGRYVEIDLYVPEFMDDSDSWKKLPFYSHYDPARLGARTTLFRDGQSVVSVFAISKQEPTAATPGTGSGSGGT